MDIVEYDDEEVNHWLEIVRSNSNDYNNPFDNWEIILDILFKKNMQFIFLCMQLRQSFEKSSSQFALILLMIKDPVWLQISLDLCALLRQILIVQEKSFSKKSQLNFIIVYFTSKFDDSLFKYGQTNRFFYLIRHHISQNGWKLVIWSPRTR